MNPYLRYSLIGLGILFLILGVIGLVVPIMQGILFIVIGLYILSVSSKRFEAWLAAKLSKFPRLKSQYDKNSGRMDRFLKRGKGR